MSPAAISQVIARKRKNEVHHPALAPAVRCGAKIWLRRESRKPFFLSNGSTPLTRNHQQAKTSRKYQLATGATGYSARHFSVPPPADTDL